MKKIFISTILLSASLVACGGGDRAAKKSNTDKGVKALNLDSIAAVSPQKVGPDTNIKIAYPNYRFTAPIINQLIHTKLDVSFDWKKKYLYGKATITLKPYYYATDTVVLDAKGMDLKEVSMISGKGKVPLKYTYDNKQIHIKLGKWYKKSETYTLFIEYVSKPEELVDEQAGSAAITSHKGLFFINANDSDKTKPREVWTQ